jgi:hypothetical protein
VIAPVHETAAQVLDGHTATSVTRRLIQTAIDGGLRPHLDGAGVRHGLYRVMLDYPSKDGLFGCLHVSARRGNVVRANLCHGNNGVERKHRKVQEIRVVLNSWAALERDRAGVR